MFAVGLVVEGLEMDCGAFALEITRDGPLSTPALFSVALWALPPAAVAFGGSMTILETTEEHVRFFPRRHSKRGFSVKSAGVNKAPWTNTNDIPCRTS
jgi:hypothetical protein